MRSLKYTTVFVLILGMVIVASCGKKAVFTELQTNRLIVVIKGTYESNSPQPWTMPTVYTTNPATGAVEGYTSDHLTLVNDDSVVDCFAIGDANPTAFMLDVAEIRLFDNYKNAHKFANYRQTYTFSLDDINPFFNGTGVLIENDDVPMRLYPFIMFFVRKILLDSPRKYVPSKDGWVSNPVVETFSEQQMPAFNFNKYLTHAFYDTLRLESTYINRVFPLVVPMQDNSLQSMWFSSDFPAVVLEIRFVVKNFIKKYEYRNYDGGAYNVVHYYAFSDWLNDVQPYETTLGGNILTVARSYIPGFVGSIHGINNCGHGAHIIAIPSNNIEEYTIPGNPGNPRSLNPCNLPNKPALYTGTDIVQALDYYIATEKFKYEWNQKVPSPCGSFSQYTAGWDKVSNDVSYKNFKIPQLAVYAADGQPYTIENVPPGTYYLYISAVPEYGRLYYDGQFTAYPNNPVVVTVGSASDSIGGTSIDFRP